MVTIPFKSDNPEEISFYQIGYKFLDIPQKVICFGDSALVEMENEKEKEKFKIKIWLMDGTSFFV